MEEAPELIREGATGPELQIDQLKREDEAKMQLTTIDKVFK
jgi:hypothetical protein